MIAAVPGAQLSRVLPRHRDEEVRAFLETEYGGLVRYLWRVTGDEEVARDLAQETVVRVFGRWGSIADPRSYAYVTATNLVRRLWRRRRDERIALVRAFVGSPPVEPAPSGELRDAVERLPAKSRDVVLLHYYADLPVAQVAAHLGRPEGTVRRQLSEARAQLATALEDPR